MELQRHLKRERIPRRNKGDDSMYVDKDYYINTYGGKLPEEEVQRFVTSASEHIDSLTFNRIRGLGFNSLTLFQQEKIKRAVCRLADFEYENEDLIQSVLASYSINGVSMSFGTSWNVIVQDGVALPRDIYSLIKQTGLARKVI